MNTTLKDSNSKHWVNNTPASIRPYLQLSRLDRPIGYWLLTLPGWMALAFSTYQHGIHLSDIKWAILILTGAVAMRGAGCTYNDIIDQNLDIQVDRTALRPLPSGAVSNKQAWIWVILQCIIGLLCWAILPNISKVIALFSIPLVMAYPFMKRITWWPQIWLGLTFNWAVLVAYSAKTLTLNLPVILFYLALVFWTLGYDTIYACQDLEDDIKVGIKSTARKFGRRVKTGIGTSYFISIFLIFLSKILQADQINGYEICIILAGIFPFAFHLVYQVFAFNPADKEKSLFIFKSNKFSGFLLILSWFLMSLFSAHIN